VVVAPSGDKAIEYLDAMPQGRALAILTDLQMPGMDGYELIEHVRADQRFGRAPIVVLSGESGQAAREKARRVGATEFFGKPYSPAQVRNCIEQLLDGQAEELNGGSG
jgi:chemosensory pili system protein ChpA (sensor histidine kinase/response regulator)